MLTTWSIRANRQICLLISEGCGPVGNVFSGRTGPRAGKTAVESLPCVCFRQSAAAGACAPRLAFEQPDLAVATYGLSQWPIELVTTAPQFGGTRRWLVCPACASRRTALYIDGAKLACRVCLGLRYASQHETERDRKFRRAHKLRDRLGWGGGVAAGGGGRPGGMHEGTYGRLCTNLASIAAEILTDLRDWAARAEAVIDRARPTT
jgi:hypothetical protein